MEMQLIMKTARSVTVALNDGGTYETKEPYRLFLNDEERKETDVVVSGLYDLEPDTAYTLVVKNKGDDIVGRLSFRTEEESVTINVKDLGAAGDGKTDDTGFIQAAVMACPPAGRVLIPAGSYRITSIFLKSGIRLELAKGAELLAETDRNHFAKFPGMIVGTNGTEEYHLGTWEGELVARSQGNGGCLSAEDVVFESLWHSLKTSGKRRWK